MAYLAWRCMVGLHDKITLSFMVVGHVSCLVDGCFGMLKRKYCRSDIFTMDQLAEVVDLSAACDVSQAVQNSSVVWYDWHNYLIRFFKPAPTVSKQHYFTFLSQDPGTVVVKQAVNSQPSTVTILKASVCLTGLNTTMPTETSAAALSPDRQKYLYEQIQQFVPLAYQNELCPAPPIED